MNKHTKIIGVALATVLFASGSSFTAMGQDKKSEKQVKIKITENGKVKTDTSFTVEKDMDSKDIDKMIQELDGENEIQAFRHRGPRHGNDVMIYRYHKQLPEMDSLMTDVEKEFHFEFRDDSLFKHTFDSAFTFKDGKL